MSARIKAAGLALVLFFPLAAPAAGLRHRPATVATYFYPVPVSYYAAYPTYFWVASQPIPVCFQAAPPVLAPRLFAVPSAAPPSTEPLIPRVSDGPSTREPPRVSDSHSISARQTTSYFPAEPRRADRCRVGFWNVSGRDHVLKVDGGLWTLPRGKSVTLDLGREFVWALEGSAGQRERIAADKSTLEIVIRR
jgi:hypothetical protein